MRGATMGLIEKPIARRKPSFECPLAFFSQKMERYTVTSDMSSSRAISSSFFASPVAFGSMRLHTSNLAVGFFSASMTYCGQISRPKFWMICAAVHAKRLTHVSTCPSSPTPSAYVPIRSVTHRAIRSLSAVTSMTPKPNDRRCL